MSVKKLLRIIFAFLFIFQISISAQATDLSNLKSQKISKGDMRKSVMALQQQGLINSEQAQEALRKIDGMNDRDIENLKNQAIDMINQQKN